MEVVVVYFHEKQVKVKTRQVAGVLVHQSIKSPLDNSTSPADSFTTSAHTCDRRTFSIAGLMTFNAPLPDQLQDPSFNTETFT